MSSLRNAISRPTHRERSQPSARSKWGLLEKHKDYSLRAADYNLKKRKLNQLQQKTHERHPDEFAFGMIKSGGQGKHGQRDSDENRLSHDAVKLLKTQDQGYLRGVAQRTRKELQRVGEEIGIGAVGVKGRQNKKVVFDEAQNTKRRRLSRDSDDDEGEIEVNDENRVDGVTAEKSQTTAPKILSRKQALKEKDKLAQLKAERKRRKRLQELRAAKLEVLKKRQKDIMAAADALELQRAKMAGNIGGTNRNGVKFKVRERKR